MNLLDQGAVGDGTTDDTQAIQATFDAAAADGAEVFVPAGVFAFSELTIPDGVLIRGVGRERSVLKANQTADWMVRLGSQIVMRDLTLDGSAADVGGMALVNTTDETAPIKDVLVENCRIDVSGSTTKRGVLIDGHVGGLTIRRCHIRGNQEPTPGGNPGQVLVDIHDAGLEISTSLPIWIDHCHLECGRVGIWTRGKGSPPAPIWFTNNFSERQKGRGAFFYNPNGMVVTDNVWQGCTHVLAESPTSDGGIVWLDGMESASGSRPTVFRGNFIRESVGNALYIEDMQGTVSGFHIKGVSKRPAAQAYNGSRGGNGVLITASAMMRLEGVSVEGCEAAGVRVDRTLGPHSSGRIKFVSLAGCVIRQNQESGILLADQLRLISVSDCMIVDNGLAQSGTHAAVHVASGSQLSQLTLLANMFGLVDGGSGDGQFYGLLSEATTALDGRVIGNYMVTGGGEWIRTAGKFNGIITANRLIGNRGFSISGDIQSFANRGTPEAGYIQLGKMGNPPAPVADHARLYVRDSGGKGQLVVRFPAGGIKVLATED